MIHREEPGAAASDARSCVFEGARCPIDRCTGLAEQAGVRLAGHRIAENWRSCMSRLAWMLLAVGSILSCGFVACAADRERDATSRRGGAKADWPQWRGPRRDDISGETGLLKQWPERGPVRRWLVEDLGKGYSGPAIAQGRLFIMGTDGQFKNELLFCFDAETGRKLWSVPIGEMLQNRWGDGPRATPTIDGDRVYTLGGQGVLLCVDAASGKTIWKKHLVEDFGGRRPNWGYTESVLIDGEQLVCSPGAGDAAVVALNKHTGATIWSCGEMEKAVHYSSIIRIESPPTYVKLTVSEVVGLDTQTGDVRWRVEFPGRTAVIPTPVYGDGHIFVTAGYGAGCKLIRVEGGRAKEVYANKNMKNHHGGVLLLDGRIYGYSDGGGWMCLDLQSGDIVWKERKALPKGAVTYADGRLYCLGERKGTVVLAGAGPNGWKEFGRFVLEPQSKIRSPSGRIWTHPVVSNGKLYLRDQEYLYCYDVAAP